ncbi:uncharacterized protein [Neodiprion pinetum]|uniref:Uncharacterized protein LOC107217465 isoform X1 n=2 Tax=Neodiprion lecontei TaxID=441921 RepID=A0ABM3GPJ9_NEOLC|nr:uncharacterized protein LOC124175081 isoform X1 [Neodiprion fabricii]XP_046410901.1 uncharacterized protein LOC124175081 isoform X1 [Neodiprion fabricii]XP_046410902.1 uncharacterized protein LOC124175081 isoform X1 [Neodiprion fabricii]XP_046410937.1 uncharacterized protein LOC124175092 isoform X1 [Neodiprion fabricii]XP_046410938.1 uncharacterized protein LOC124175092 isoform X1 [Neodiprion fabricii]XP_046410939.1 uncharacterized protein LOC124175092 isoform X1 [Neodiprion fabricii]XP_04
MYAVIEFLVGEDRECALVPVLWLVENNTQCYWPRTKTEDHFTKLVKSKAAYEKTWPKFAIHKVLHTGDDYHDTEATMARLLELGTSDESGIIRNIAKKSTVIPQQDITNDVDENEATNSDDVEPEPQKKKRKHKTDKKKAKNRHVSNKKKKTKRSRESSSSLGYTSSADENLPPSEVDESTSNRNKNTRYINSAKGSTKNQTPKKNLAHKIVQHQYNDNSHESPNQLSGYETSNRNISSRIIRSTTQYDLSRSFSQLEPSTPTTSREQNTFEEKTLQYLEHIKSYTEQNHLLLRKIFSKQKEVSIDVTKKPAEFPKLPLNSMEDFSNLENILKSEEHRTYLTGKLASVGGTSGRQCVLAIMRSLLTNELAMQFNWAGRDKVPFQKTLTMETVYEAVKQTFLGKKEIGDATETSVSCAVKDWLKLARSRHTYVRKKG